MTKQIKDIAFEVRETYVPSVDDNLPYIGLEHVEQESLTLNGIGKSSDVASQKYKFQKGDILFGTLRPYFRKVIIAPTDGICSTEFSVIRPINNEDQYFLFYCIAQPSFIKYATGKSKGARPRTKWKLFSDFDIRINNQLERRKLGTIISFYDRLIQNNKRRIELLEKAARLLYKEWFVQLRFPGHEHTKIVDGVPEGWGKVKIGNYSLLNYGKSLRKDKREEGPFHVYGSSGVIGSHNEFLIEGPCIIVGRKGNVGSVYWSPKNCYPIDTVYYVEHERSSLYLYYALQNVNFINTDVAVPGLNRDLAHSREILIPSDILFEEFESNVNEFHNQINILGKANNSLNKARDLLLPKLMNGDIPV